MNNLAIEDATDLSTFVGIAINGVPLSSAFNDISMPVDPLFPIAYGPVWNPNDALIKNDACMTNLWNYDSVHQYNIISPCLVDAQLRARVQINDCQEDADCSQGYKKYVASEWSYKKLLPVGIAMDGHPIYGPYKNDGSLWQPCEVDICNGVFMNGQYAYVATLFHPYFVGCWGPGNEPIGLSQSCSSNPR